MERTNHVVIGLLTFFFTFLGNGGPGAASIFRSFWIIFFLFSFLSVIYLCLFSPLILFYHFFFVCWMRVRDYAFGRLLIMFHSLVSFPLGKETSDSFIASVWILAALSLLLQRLLLLLLLLMRRILVLQPSSALLDWSAPMKWVSLFDGTDRDWVSLGKADWKLGFAFDGIIEENWIGRSEYRLIFTSAGFANLIISWTVSINCLIMQW